MTSLYQLHMDPHLTFDQAWEVLEKEALSILYGTEEEKEIVFIIQSEIEPNLENIPEILSCHPYTLPAIDWESQWALHSSDFHDGFAHIHLEKFKDNAPTLCLAPGAGFGDFSHITTQLAMQALARYAQDCTVIDIGCGSGILTLAAVAMGAESSYGIDIDPEALFHSQKNSQLNHLLETTHFCLPQEFVWPVQKNILIVMNMIHSEQIEAWGELSSKATECYQIITTGIRVEERDLYLKQASQWGWILRESFSEEGWCVFIFSCNS